MASYIRHMQPQDVDDVYAIEMAAYRAPWSRQILLDCVLVGYDCRVMEVQNDQQCVLIGYSIARLNEGIGHILNLCVDPLFQGKGHGEYLFKSVLDSLREQSVDTIILEVRASNVPALGLYQKMGFVKQGIKPGYYRDDRNPEDAVVFKKKLG